MKLATDQTVDELLRALAHPDRRRLLRLLSEQQASDGQDRVSVATLTSALDTPDQRAHVDLHHRHLPALQSVGLIERLDDGQTDGGSDDQGPTDDQDIAPGPRLDRAVTVLDALSETGKET